MMLKHLSGVLVGLLSFCHVGICQDTIDTPGANGKALVKGAIDKVQDAGIFPDDHSFLLRVAWVESRFGIDDDTFTNGGGIFQMDEAAFEDTKNTAKYGDVLQDVLDQVQAEFGIDWKNVPRTDLNKPFIAALAARLLIWTKPTIPEDLNGQEEYWKQHFNSINGAEKTFMTTVKVKGDPHVVQTFSGSASPVCYDLAAVAGKYLLYKETKLDVEVIIQTTLHRNGRVFIYAVWFFCNGKSYHIYAIFLMQQPFSCDGLVYIKILKVRQYRHTWLNVCITIVGGISEYGSGILAEVDHIASIGTHEGGRALVLQHGAGKFSLHPLRYTKWCLRLKYPQTPAKYFNQILQDNVK